MTDSLRARAREYVWAIDPGKLRVAAAFVSQFALGEIAETDMFTLPVLERDGSHFGKLAQAVREHALAWADDYPPVCVWVEQPSGAARNLELAYATGVIQGAVWEATHAPIFMVAPSAWKLEALGHGNASKTEVAAWVAEQGIRAGSQDEADAAAMVLAGRRKVARGTW